MIPVNIISGFFGSGKTSAIIRLLTQKNPEESWAIVVNEFGKVSIDGQTLQSKSIAGSVFEISGGCICCSAKGYLHENLNKILESGKYHRIIIEPSGLGGLDMVTDIVVLKPELQLMPVVCMVDLTAIENTRLQMNFIYKNQISRAGWIVFSKSDLLSEVGIREQLVGKFKALFPEKKHLLSVEDLTTELLYLDLLNAENNKSQFVFAPDSSLMDKNFEKKYFQFEIDKLFDTEKLTSFFREHPSILRAKGHIQTENGWKLINFTLSGCTFETCLPKNQGELVIIAEKSADHPFPDFQEKMKDLLT